MNTQEPTTPETATPAADGATDGKPADAPVETPAKPPMTAKERAAWNKRMAEHRKREADAIRVIKKLAPAAWRSEWVLHPLDWLETKADELREAADLKKQQQPKATKAA